MSEKEIEVYGKQMDEIRVRPYEHHAKYYETDQMGIIHHSNYIKWMEEARMDMMEQIGLSYKEMEAMEKHYALSFHKGAGEETDKDAYIFVNNKVPKVSMTDQTQILSDFLDPYCKKYHQWFYGREYLQL